MSTLLIVFGDKTADEILPIAREQHADQFDEITKTFFDEQTVSDTKLKEMMDRHDAIHFIIGVVDTGLRKRIQEFAEEAGLVPFTVVHRSAEIAASAKIGAGCFIAQQAVVSVNAVIGDFSIIHIHASIGHDSRLGTHCTVLPGARISGEVTLGDGVLVGSNSFVFQKVTVGQDTQIDALTYVRNDLPAGTLASSRLSKPVRRLDQ